jgi:arginyl-tRNA synthetase
LIDLEVQTLEVLKEAQSGKYFSAKILPLMFFTRVSKIIDSILPENCDYTLEVPPDNKFGDLACNAAMVLAKKLGKNPRELAEEIAKQLAEDELIEKAEVAGPGFINIFLTPRVFQDVLEGIEQAGKNYGSWIVDRGSSKSGKVLLEFISANPTGPLTIANGRGGFGGDVLSRVLRRAGYDVSTEYYVNDAGNQIDILGKSIQAAAGKIEDEEDFYQGEYIKDLAEKHPDKITDDAVETGSAFAEILLETEIKPAVEKMGVKIDNWFSEAELRQSGGVEDIYKYLKDKDLSYEKDDAIWLKTSEYGDDKDRVIQKSDGSATYVLPDLMYHKNKFERGFTKLIDILGADHHGYVPRLKIGVKMLGFGEVEVVIAQLVKLFRGDKEIRMSKRAGNFELMDDLIDEVGADAARWFFVMRDWNTHLNFDLDLAKKQSSENPVFYVQYAHARMNQIFEKADPASALRATAGGDGKDLFKLLRQPEEFALIKKMAELPDLIAELSETYAIHQLTTYARELAETFHKFYEQCRVIDEENIDLSAARLRLVAVAKEVLRIVLEDLVGVKAPEKM